MEYVVIFIHIKNMTLLKYLFCIILYYFVITDCLAQSEYFIGGSNGELIVSETSRCNENELGSNLTMMDIASTPNGKIYGINSYLYEINPINSNITNIGIPTTASGDHVGGSGLVALNNGYLIADDWDSLFLVSVLDASAINLGYTGTRCNGDLAFFNGFLYMIDYQNKLVKITLDVLQTSIANVEFIGQMDTDGNNAYGLFSTFESCTAQINHLYALAGDILYLVNENDASVEKICKLDNDIWVYGAASSNEHIIPNPELLIANVFTPNGDGLNDTLFINPNLNLEKFTVYNRWGNIVYESGTEEYHWEGQAQNGTIVNDGVYYIIGNLNCHYFSQGFSGLVTVLKQ